MREKVTLIQHLNNKYPHAGGGKALDKIMKTTPKWEDQQIAIYHQFNITLAAAKTWIATATSGIRRAPTT